MKKILFGVIVFAAMSANAQVKPKPSIVTKPKTATTKVKMAAPLLKSSKDSFSYALGLAIASNMQQQGIDSIDYSILKKGMEDISSNSKPQLDQMQAQGVIKQRMEIVQAKRQALQKQMQEENAKKLDSTKAAGKAFLADNGKRPGVITLPDGLEYEVVKKGDTSIASPTDKDTVVANYKGTLIDGTEFDESYKRGEPLTITAGGVIKGWTEALELMHPGDSWKLYIPSELGYGDNGQGPIPGGATLVFELQLLSVKHPK